MLNLLKKSFQGSWGVLSGALSVLFIFPLESILIMLQWMRPNPSEVAIIVARLLVCLVTYILIVACKFVHLKHMQSVKIKGHNYEIEVEYGDILEQENYKRVINFDECFTTKVGHKPEEIKPNSICGQYLLRHPKLPIQMLIQDSKIKPEVKGSRYRGKVCYASGKIVPNGDDLLMAFAKLDENGLGTMTRKELVDCLMLMWEEVDKYYEGMDVCVPILGSGITRLGDSYLTQQELLDLLIGTYKISAYKIKLPHKLRIICKECDNFAMNRVGDTL